ncbi:MAG: peptide chain release factor N(5)-glutamine methyltransferase [Cyclobacteriaceae bacterium]|nr:peptide chain release factor N(5)-glutamine methyltransferase [Cyclobacteriaceae bacterium]
MKTKELYNSISTELTSLYDEQEANSIAFLLLEAILGITKTDCIVNTTLHVSLMKDREIKVAIEKLLRHEPIQYVLGKADFYGREFVVDANVLIPRNETEELVQLIINENKASNLKIVDIGTGSGCIPISLYLALDNAEVEAVDISEAALAIAQQNASALDAHITFNHFDILSGTPLPNQYHIIVSNPPYVTQNEKTLMRPNVLNFEPHLALFVEDNDPLIFYNAIVQHSKHSLYNEGRLYFEINENLGVEVASIMENAGFKKTRIIQDLNGKDRIVTGVMM